MPDLDHKALEEACRAVAANTMWNHDEPRDMADIITTEEIEEVVAEYVKIAVGIAESVEEVDGDPNLVTRAIDYMALQHAIPPMRDDVRWFRECLHAIVLLACPDVWGWEASYHPVHDDILYGIAISRKKRV